MKVVILGAKGMLGRDLGKVFYSFSPYLLDKEDLDITKTEGVFALFRHLKPDLVINASGYTDVDGCETNKALAMKLNAEAPGYIAAASKDVGAVFVHYSTDYVFHGDKAEGYKEDDIAENPLSFYGKSKLVGEDAVKEVGGKYYLIRTSWLFGINGANFVETILRIARDNNEIKVVNDQHGKPTFSLDLSKKTRELIEGKKEFGIYHLTNELVTTWYDFAKEILRKNTDVNTSVLPCTSDEFPRPAKRPAYSILLNTKLSPMRPWQEALGEYLKLRN